MLLKMYLGDLKASEVVSGFLRGGNKVEEGKEGKEGGGGRDERLCACDGRGAMGAAVTARSLRSQTDTALPRRQVAWRWDEKGVER